MSTGLNRRNFLKRTMVAAGLPIRTLGQARALADDGAALPIVDTHQHLWDLERLRLPWLSQAKHLARSYRIRDYLRASRGLNVVKTVYMEVDVDPAQHDLEAKIVIDLCQRRDNPMVAAVISGRPGSEGFRDYILRYKDSPYIKGVRRLLHQSETPPGHCLSKQFIASVRLLGELGMSFDLHPRVAELPDAARLAEACPDTRFVLDHCGGARPGAKDLSGWRQGMAKVAELKNTVCKVSGIVAGAPEGWRVDHLAPIINHTIDTFGPERVMFASDWPVCTRRATFQQWVEALRTITADRPIAELRKLWHDNAVQFYGLA